MRRVIAPLAAGVLSALGLVVSERRRDVLRSVLLTGKELTREAVGAAVRELGEQGRGDLGAPDAELRATYDLRYEGQAFELPVDGELEPDPADLRARFDRAHEDRYGYADSGAGLAWSPFGWRPRSPERRRPSPSHSSRPSRARAGRCSAETGSRRRCWGRVGARGGARDRGSARLDAGRAAGMASERGRRRRGDGAMSGVDPVALQVMLGALRAACDEMGAVLVRSAQSANIKERRDASTALFDERGRMVMQAERIPVHLGAMPSALAAVIDEEQRPGVSFVLNDPYRGGTHLPDITVITPLHHERELVGFAASRAHHADVGATEPGSMPADSRTLGDEGVVIPPTRLSDEVIREARGQDAQPGSAGGRPARAARRRAGRCRVTALVERFGLATLRAGLEETLDYAERRTRARIAELEDGVRTAEDVPRAATATSRCG